MSDWQNLLFLQEEVLKLQKQNIELKAIVKFGGFKAGKLKGQKLEQEHIIALIKSKEWVGQTLAEDVDNLVRLIKGKK